MKQLFLCLFLTTVALDAAMAQTPALAAAAAGKRTEEYCQVVAQARLNGRYVVSIDYGQQQKVISANLYRDAAGKVVEFNSAMDALNWLNAQGWELASTFVEPAGGAYYVMRRPIR